MLARVTLLVALSGALAALVASVLERRAPGTFPLATLIRDRFPWPTSSAPVVIGAGAGVASVVVPWAVAVLNGWAHSRLAWDASASVAGLAAVSMLVKVVMAAIEELVFRGAVLPQVARRAGPAAGTAVSAVLFALAHAARPPFDLATFLVIALDGVGFAWLALASDGLWAPTTWHAAKNLCVWALGGGTIQFVAGPLSTDWSGPVSWTGADGSAGALDLLVTLSVLVLVVTATRRRRDASSRLAR